MAKLREREQALLLRKKGWSVQEISSHLHVSKSTVSIWCRDVTLSSAARKRLLTRTNHKAAAGLLAYSERRRKQRAQQTKYNTQVGQEQVGNLSARDLYCIGLGLYWGEGYKHGNREFGFTNSDPDMVKFYINWLKHVFGISPNQLTFRVSINELHAHRLVEVEQYWSRITGVQLSQFTRSSLIKTNQKKKFSNMKTHYGTLRIKVKNGSDFREQILGAITHICRTHQR